MLKSRGKERKMTELLIKGIPITLLLEEDNQLLTSSFCWPFAWHGTTRSEKEGKRLQQPRM